MREGRLKIKVRPGVTLLHYWVYVDDVRVGDYVSFDMALREGKLMLKEVKRGRMLLS